MILGFLVWFAYTEDALSTNQENQYCDIKTTLVQTIDKSGKVINEESFEYKSNSFEDKCFIKLK